METWTMGIMVQNTTPLSAKYSLQVALICFNVIPLAVNMVVLNLCE